jgi:FlaA1/EpsC-like NDP-sugar epimerase
MEYSIVPKRLGERRIIYYPQKRIIGLYKDIMYINKDVDYIKYLQNRKIIIFGAGNAGKKGLAKIKKSIANADIIAVCDNDKKKQGAEVAVGGAKYCTGDFA